MDLDEEAMQVSDDKDSQGYEEKGWLLRNNENVPELMVTS